MGDFVRIIEQAQKVKELQKNHGEWTDNMKPVSIYHNITRFVINICVRLYIDPTLDCLTPWAPFRAHFDQMRTHLERPLSNVIGKMTTYLHGEMGGFTSSVLMILLILLTLTGREPCYCGFIVPTPSGGNRDITFYNSYVYMHEITQ